MGVIYDKILGKPRDSESADLSAEIAAINLKFTSQALTLALNAASWDANSGFIATINLTSATNTVTITASNFATGDYKLRVTQGTTKRNITFAHAGKTITQMGGGGATITAMPASSTSEVIFSVIDNAIIIYPQPPVVT